MRIYVTVLLILISSAFLYPQEKRFHAFSGNFALSVEGGVLIPQTDYDGFNLNYTGRFSLEYFFNTFNQSSFGLRLLGSAGFISQKDAKRTPDLFKTDFNSIGFQAVYALSIKDKTFPYFAAGVSNLWFEPKDEFGKPLSSSAPEGFSKTELNYNAELGIRFILTQNLSFNFSVGAQISPNDNLDALTIGADNDLFFHSLIGFTYAFFSERDSDLDGVPDDEDACPKTPHGVEVDKFGCPVDSDKDGVPDYLDKCSDTPEGVKVDRSGCPVDSDKDGIPDYTDICPDTPPGVEVDDLGCPYDRDGDGVPDYLDKCPDTPYNVPVDERGCPADSDLDGVPDYKDKCPNTPPGEQVDKDGCSIFKQTPEDTLKNILKDTVDTKAILPVEPGMEISDGMTNNDDKEFIFSATGAFVKNKNELMPDAYDNLDRIISVMKSNPLSRWVVEVYSPVSSDNAGNKKISLEQAERIAAYFEKNGVPKIRLETAGFSGSEKMNNIIRIVRTN